MPSASRIKSGNHPLRWPFKIEKGWTTAFRPSSSVAFP